MKDTTVVALAQIATGLGVDPSTLLDLRAEASTDEHRTQAAKKSAALDHGGLLTQQRLLDAVAATQ